MKPSSFSPAILSLWVFLGLTFACAAHPLDLWNARFTNNTSLYSVTYGAGNFVAVGSVGMIAHSTNGIDWTAVTETAQTLSDVTYGAGKFVAVGSTGTILTSTNAMDWDDRSPGTNLYLQKVVYGNSRFVALGYSISPVANYSLVSTDGVTWNTYFVASNKPAGIFAYGSFGNGLFVYSEAVQTNLLSADGISWWPQLTGMTNGLYMIGSGNGQLVAFDTRSLTFTSDDGTNWALCGTNNLLRPEGLAYGNGDWVAVGRGGAASYSTDLVHWTHVTNLQTTAFGTCFGNGTFVTANKILCQSDPVILLQPVAGSPGTIAIFGPAGTTYQIQALNWLDQTDWLTISNLTVDTTPFLWTDPDATEHSQRFYRVQSP